MVVRFYTSNVHPRHQAHELSQGAPKIPHPTPPVSLPLFSFIPGSSTDCAASFIAITSFITGDATDIVDTGGFTMATTVIGFHIGGGGHKVLLASGIHSMATEGITYHPRPTMLTQFPPLFLERSWCNIKFAVYRFTGAFNTSCQMAISIPSS